MITIIGQNMYQNDDKSQRESTRYACPKWEAVHDYILAIGRRLTEAERKAFLHFLDMEEDESERHNDDCICIEIMAIVVKALEPEPVDRIVAERTKEDAEIHYHPTRFHAEQTGSKFGIILETKTKLRHTMDLVGVGKELVEDLKIIIAEIDKRRDLLGIKSSAEVCASCFPDLAKLSEIAASVSTPTPLPAIRSPSKKKPKPTATSTAVSAVSVRDNVTELIANLNASLGTPLGTHRQVLHQHPCQR
jgi:hypothetical protein